MLDANTMIATIFAAVGLAPTPQPAQEPPPQPAAIVAPSLQVASPGTTTVPAARDVWTALAVCESGNGKTSSNIWQFQQATWRGMGMSGRPGDAPRSVQLETAQRLVARYGFASQFPACSRRLGLR